MKGLELAAELKFNLDYARWIDEENRIETWEDSVNRVMDMHRKKFPTAFDNPRFVELFNRAHIAYNNKHVLGSQRALQFGGEPMFKHNARMFNCVGGYIDKISSFQHIMYFLLCGCGVGFSVQHRHVNKLPSIRKRATGVKTFIVPDSIEGWSDAFGILVSSFINPAESEESSFPEYCGYEVRFDLSNIRPEGALISGGFKAPGPEGLRKALLKVESLLEKTINEGNSRMKPIIAYDIVMHMSDAVLSGGVRRSATIALFSPEDAEMMNAKTGNWYNENPQRARSNNSVVLVRSKTTKEKFDEIFECIKSYGEPGFFFVEDEDELTNPCVEIRFWPKVENEDGSYYTGFQGCNLTEGNGGACTTEEKFYQICESLAVLGTMQAAYTDFKYVGDQTKFIFDREALLGCSFTGWMANPHIMMNPEIQHKGAEIIKSINAELAPILGINVAARTTTSKPSGNASVLLMSPSGAGGDHAPQYFRCMQINKFSEIGKLLESDHPYLIEESVWSSNNTDHVAFIPIVSNKKAKFKSELLGINQLEVVRTIQNNWIEAGTNVEYCIKPWLRHSVSNTVELNYEDFDSVNEYLFEHKNEFAAVSFLLHIGDKIYNQAPFTSVLTREQLVEKYSDAALFASGLIVDGLQAFDNNLWQACDYTTKRDIKLIGTRMQVMLQRDWLRKAKQFAKRFFRNNLEEMTICLKDIHLYHKWVAINRELKNKDFSFEKLNVKPEYTNIDTMGALACSGGSCEMPAEYMERFNTQNQN
jgi:ribonucleoside-triphosphate reductase